MERTQQRAVTPEKSPGISSSSVSVGADYDANNDGVFYPNWPPATTNTKVPYPNKDIDFNIPSSRTFHFNSANSNSFSSSVNSNSKRKKVDSTFTTHAQNRGKNRNSTTSVNNFHTNSVMNMTPSIGLGSNCEQQTQSGLPNGRKIAEELEDFVERGLEGALAAERGEEGAPSEEAIAELQLQTARKLRQLLPINRDNLHLVQERNWIPLLLGWLNLHDRPAVQVEALWALTNIAGLSTLTSWSASPPATLLLPPDSPGTPYLNNSFNFSNTPTSHPITSPYLPSTMGGNGFSSSSSIPLFKPQISPKNSQGMMTSGPTSSMPMFPPTSVTPGGNARKVSPNLAPSNISAVLSSSAALAFSPPAFPSPPVSFPSTNMFLPPASATAPISSDPLTSTGNGPSQKPSSPVPSTHLLLSHPDAIPTLVSLLNSPNREVHEQAMWILGSVAADQGNSTSNAHANNSASMNGGSTNCSSSSSSSSQSAVSAAREAMLASGVMGPLICCLETNPHNLSLQRIGSWFLSNLVDSRNLQNSNSGSNGKNNSGGNSGSNNVNSEIDARMLLPTLRRLLHMGDAEVLSHTCWALSHLCDGPSSHIVAFVSPSGGLVPRLVDLLPHPSWRVTKPALRTIGNIVCAECVDDSSTSPTNDDLDGNSPPIPTDYTEIILECGAVPRLKELITHGNREIQKEACWTLSNIAAGTVDQIQAVIDSDAISPLVKLASNPKTDQEVRSEACWVVLNATSCGSDLQIENLVAEGCVSVLGMLLGEASMVMMALEGLERVLQVEEAKEMTRKARIAANETRGLSVGTLEASNNQRGSVVSASLIEALEQHKNSAVAKRAGKIWKQHFVSCALCHQSFSRHRTSEARFCKECKCHVCSGCNCEIYHLSYQEELWAANEEKTKATQKAKKSKKLKKKEKRKQAQARKQSASLMNNECSEESNKSDSNVPNRTNKDGEEESMARSRSSTVSSSSESGPAASQIGRPPVNELAVVPEKKRTSQPDSAASLVENNKNSKKSKAQKKRNKKKSLSGDSPIGKSTKPHRNKEGSSSVSEDDDEDDDLTNKASFDEKKMDSSDIDFVKYLQQTGSIIALAKLMDTLDAMDGDTDINDHLCSPSVSHGFNGMVLSRQAEA